MLKYVNSGCDVEVFVSFVFGGPITVLFSSPSEFVSLLLSEVVVKEVEVVFPCSDPFWLTFFPVVVVVGVDELGPPGVVGDKNRKYTVPITIEITRSVTSIRVTLIRV